MSSHGEKYVLRCYRCGTLVMREQMPEECPACERRVVKTRHRKKDGMTTFDNVTSVVV